MYRGIRSCIKGALLKTITKEEIVGAIKVWKVCEKVVVKFGRYVTSIFSFDLGMILCLNIVRAFILHLTL